MANYSFKTTGLPEPVGGVIEGHNFLQGSPHTVIYSGQVGLTFRNCNLINCELPSGSIVEGSKYPRLVSFCSHVHEDWLANGYIPPCSSDCTHRTVVDTITIDGVSVDTHSTYEDKGL